MVHDLGKHETAINEQRICHDKKWFNPPTDTASRRGVVFLKKYGFYGERGKEKITVRI
jgi:hypothetical protein